MSDVNCGEGVQVVKLGDGPKRYQVDEDALRGILMRPDVQDRTVVVVSVAGAYRGGKSFILDFFLRYINAKRGSQLNGEWLGQENQPLKGFHWRGGSERDTTGIHLWSEPILATLEGSGEEVAVLLMDTQGTFDTASTIGQNSTIFALSTLISSVQIYNLFRNIQEDDLQHLQLFAEYGKLACAAGEKAFQTLIFLVRDWTNHYEHPHGFGGGESLLNLRLTSSPDHPTELREVRERIRSCFDQIKCFLMPHPGLNIAEIDFDGRLSDIDDRFKKALLEMVPSLFDPKHLTPKLINGQRVRARDLFDYFKTYVDIFNSDDVPEAVTIFRATAEVCLQAAMREARELYESRMDTNVREEVSVPTSTLSAWHHAARDAALDLYSGKKKLGAPEDINRYRVQLINDLEARLKLYVSNNDAKVRDLVLIAKKAYDDTVSSVCEVHTRLCLHPLDLKNLLAKALSTALNVFDNARNLPENAVDEDRTDLVKCLGQQYDHFCSVNEQNNKVAVMEARDLYVTQMKKKVGQTGVSSDLLRQQHQLALGDAQAYFKKQTNRVTDREDDLYMDLLIDEISTCFADFEKLNVDSNKMAMQWAEYTYNNYITAAWGPQSRCFHPRGLEDLHRKAVDVALKQFLSNRSASKQDDYKSKLRTILNTRYNELKTVNDSNNQQAVEHALHLYKTNMEKEIPPLWMTSTDVEFLLKIVFTLLHNNTIFKDVAKKAFYDRRGGEMYDYDTYYEHLMEECNKAFANYKGPVMALMEQQNARK